jgi:hypothetical protein
MSACDFEIGENMTVEEIRIKYSEISKLYKRVMAHGDNVVHKTGRKPVSAEHKKATYDKWLEIRKQQRAEKAIAEGRVPRNAVITAN